MAFNRIERSPSFGEEFARSLGGGLAKDFQNLPSPTWIKRINLINNKGL